MWLKQNLITMEECPLVWLTTLFKQLKKKNGRYILGVRAEDEVIVTRPSISNSHICDGSGSKGATRVLGTTSAAVTWCWWLFFSFFLLVSSSVLLPSSGTFLWVISCFTSLGLVPWFYCNSSPAAAPECFFLPSLLYMFRHYHLSSLVSLASRCFRTFLSSLGSILGPALIRCSCFIRCSALRPSSSYFCFLSKLVQTVSFHPWLSVHWHIVILLWRQTNKW